MTLEGSLLARLDRLASATRRDAGGFRDYAVQLVKPLSV
jgi:hypothetical protein